MRSIFLASLDAITEDHQAALLEDRRGDLQADHPEDHREALEATLSAFTARPEAAVGDQAVVPPVVVVEALAADLMAAAAVDRLEVPAADHREAAAAGPQAAVIGLLDKALTVLARHLWLLKDLCLSR